MAADQSPTVVSRRLNRHSRCSVSTRVEPLPRHGTCTWLGPFWGLGHLSAFEATASETAPAAYFIPADQRDALIKLQIHGIGAEPLGEEMTMQVERFRITSSVASEREFQQHNERTVEGAWESAEVTLPADTMVILVDQPLGRLAFSLLEPRAADGFTNWNFFDRALMSTALIVQAAQNWSTARSK